MRLTLRSSLAMRTLMYCAVNDGRTVKKHQIAAACNASENHLGQVIHRLSQLGYLHTMRGRTGGLRLGQPMEEIRVGAVLRAMETPVPFAECFDSAGNCPLVAACRLRPALAAAIEGFYEALLPVSLRDLVEGNDCLAELLENPAPAGGRGCATRQAPLAPPGRGPAAPVMACA